jgi:hypothetical protein
MLYACCLQYIQCLRKSGNIEKLRAAREEMNKYYPLTPKMWQEWANDEISLSTRFVIVFSSIIHVMWQSALEICRKMSMILWFYLSVLVVMSQ